jgi:polyphenol oxidase
VAVVVASERGDGDVHPETVEAGVLRARQRSITGRAWAMLDEVHGVEVCHIHAPPAGPMAARGDVLVTSRADVHLAVWAADCAPLVLVGASGTTVAAHAGWRGLAMGVVDVAVDVLHDLDEAVAIAVLGPAIHQCCYEFGNDDLRAVAAGAGVERGLIRGQTTSGSAALDVPAAVRGVLERRGVTLDVTGPCTGCDHRWFSHRARRDAGRHAVIAWTETPTETPPRTPTRNPAQG